MPGADPIWSEPALGPRTSGAATLRLGNSQATICQNEGKDMLAQQRCGTGADSVDFLAGANIRILLRLQCTT